MLKRPFFLLLVWALSIWIVTGCGKSSSIEKRLSGIDRLLQVDPQRGIDSLSTIDIKELKYSEIAYYNLLLTIAQHKGNIPFTSDSLISFSLQWFKSHGDTYNYARACFYHGLTVLFVMKDNAKACEEIRQALQLLSNSRIKDERLEALACAYLGRINDLRTLNLPEASEYYRRAVEIERRLDNGRNLISNYCSLLVCYVKMGEASLAKETLNALDSVQAIFPDCRLEKTKNAKALYYLHLESDLDSALFYCLSYNPLPGDAAAKAFLLSEIYQRKDLWPEAIAYAKKALSDRPESDTLSIHVYYQNLAYLYSQTGAADSSAHYAQLAYEALKGSVSQKTEKRILELEKQYDLSAKEAELERARLHRSLMAVSLMALLLLSGGLALLLRNREQKLRAERITRSIVQAAARTHQFTLSSLKPFAARRKSVTAEEMQKGVADLAAALRKGFSDNFAAAIESSLDALTPRQRAEMQKLSGERAKTVYILTELGYGEEAIAAYTCTSADSVRVTINNNKKILGRSPRP